MFDHILISILLWEIYNMISNSNILCSLNPSFKISSFSLLLIDSTFLRNRNVRPPNVRRYWNLIFDFYEHKKIVYIIMYRYKIYLHIYVLSYQFHFNGNKLKKLSTDYIILCIFMMISRRKMMKSLLPSKACKA